MGGGMLLAFASSRVGVVVNSRVPGEFIRAREALGAPGKSTGVWLFSRVRPDVTSLVLETVEGLVAERALVGTREVLSRLFLLLWGVLE